MENYVSVMRTLGYRRAAALMETDVRRMFVSFDASPEWYGFPPALIPIMSDGSLPMYVGLWRHWFGGRSDSFVDMSVSQGYEVTEIARTESQFCDVLAARLIVLHDDVTDEVTAYAEAVDLDDLAAVDVVTLETGDDPKGYVGLPSFRIKIPAESAVNQYDGAFPIVQARHHNLIFECREPPNVPDAPWLDSENDHPSAFEAALAAGDHLRAWRHMNARGWSFSDAAVALLALAEQAGDPEFSKMAETWVERSWSCEGGY